MASESATTSSSNAIERRFAELRAAGRRALVAYVTAGFPDVHSSRVLLSGLGAAGVDIVEIGVPFSDPIADGPVIQASSQRALEGGMTIDGAMALAPAAGAVPTVLFTYLNPLLAAGPDAPHRIREAGVDGILVTDLPAGVDQDREAWLSGSGLALIRLVAPTTPPGRVAEIARHASGFLYVISRLGVTGARTDVADPLRDTVARVRAATDLPVCVGFGISEPAQARLVSTFADGIIVGSALVTAAGQGVDAALSLVRSFREALDAAD